MPLMTTSVIAPSVRLDRVNPQAAPSPADGSVLVTATIGTHLSTLRRDDGSPCQDGDVLSVQPDGTWQTRPAGTAGAFELATLSNDKLVYCPVGAAVFVYGYTATVPNV